MNRDNFEYEHDFNEIYDNILLFVLKSIGIVALYVTLLIIMLFYKIIGSILLVIVTLIGLCFLMRTRQDLPKR